jgi:hypothetical protein
MIGTRVYYTSYLIYNLLGAVICSLISKIPKDITKNQITTATTPEVYFHYLTTMAILD